MSTLHQPISDAVTDAVAAGSLNRDALNGRLALHENNIIDLEIAIGDGVDDCRRADEHVQRLRAQLAVERAILGIAQEEAADVPA